MKKKISLTVTIDAEYLTRLYDEEFREPLDDFFEDISFGEWSDEHSAAVLSYMNGDRRNFREALQDAAREYVLNVLDFYVEMVRDERGLR